MENHMSFKDLKIKIFADGADVEGMLAMHKEGWVRGFTTNPTLMRKAGVTDYEKFARGVLQAITDLPVSFEVFSDDIASMEREARKISSWGANVYTKIPVTNTKGESTAGLIRSLSQDGIKLNVTAILTLEQTAEVVGALKEGVSSIVSVFAGRIADTGRDPLPLMRDALKLCLKKKRAELLWASTRELLNIYQAEEMGCHIITVTNDILKKGAMAGMDLKALSLDTVKMFYKDAQASAFKI
jgi:transaldolase